MIFLFMMLDLKIKKLLSVYCSSAVKLKFGKENIQYLFLLGENIELLYLEIC